VPASVQNHYNLSERGAWLLRRSSATLPIPGTLSLAHLKENLAALEIELTDAEFDALS
jgi:pyridoxine 4-dehydrogenase